MIQSNTNFAITHLNTTDLKPVGKQLLAHAAKQLLLWLSSPEWLQVHIWRYAFCRQPLAVSCLATELPLPLTGAGDWCGGNQVAGAFAAANPEANSVNSQLSGGALHSGE